MIDKKTIQDIVGTCNKHKLKKYVLTKGGEIIESSKLTYDDFMKCYGYELLDNETQKMIFNMVVIEKESDNIDDLEKAQEC